MHLSVNNIHLFARCFQQFVILTEQCCEPRERRRFKEYLEEEDLTNLKKIITN